LLLKNNPMWSKYPLLRVLIPFVIGVIIADQFFGIINSLFFGVVALVLLTILAIFWFRFSHRLKTIRGSLFLASMLFIAISYTTSFKASQFQLPTSSTSDTLSYVATIAEPPTEKERSIKITCKIEQFFQEKKMHKTAEKCILYLGKDSNSLNLNYGDKILFYTQLKEIPIPLNPSEFDYSKSLFRKGVRYQSYVNGYGWKKIDASGGNFIMHLAYNLRQNFLTILTQYGLDSQEYGVISAILLGFNDKLDPELSAHYTGAGVTHVLSVSGMHVGVIYMILNFFLQFLDKNKHTKVIKFFALIFLIWLYAAITGLSPSVLRSATMFSFIAIGNMLQQKVNTYHSLIASFMFLLILDPFVIFNIGLQLSYLAVFGIVWLQRPIALLWIPKFKIVDWAWQLISVSLAAQLVTTPISIFYFHQFPNYFILSNLLVVFISSLVIYAGVAVLATSFWYWLSNILAFVMVWLIKAMNYITIFISDLPGSRTENIDLNWISMVFLYVFIFSLLLGLLYKNKKLLWSSLISAILFLSLLTYDNIEEYNSNKMVIYALNKQTVVDIKTSNSMITLCDSSVYFSKTNTSFQVKNARISDGIQPDTSFLLTSNNRWNQKGIKIWNQFVEIGTKKIAFVNQQPYGDSNMPIEVDYAVVIGNPKLKMNIATGGIKAKTWAFDGSNSTYKIQKWVKECDSLHLKSYVIGKEGALVLEF